MKKQSKIKVMFRMLKLVKPLSGRMTLAVIMGSLGFLAAQFIPVFGGYAILYGMGISIPLPITLVLICLILFAVIRAFLRYTEQRTNHYIAFKLLAIIRDRVFKALRKLCPAKLEGRDKGDLISVITSDVELLEVFYAHTISPVYIAVIVEIIMCIFIGAYHWSQGILALIAFAVIGVLLPLIISKRSGTLGDELRSQSGELAAYMLENIRGVDETLQFDHKDFRMKEMNAKTEELTGRQGILNKLTGTNSALANTLILIFDALMLILCALLYSNKIVGFDGFLIPLIAMVSSFGPVTALANLGTTLQPTIASGARVLSIIDEEPETEDITEKETVDFNGAALKEVSFGYAKADNDEAVLSGLSAEFAPKRMIGVVGKSGCGKSTMLKLLMRFWEADAGSVKISGQDINEINTNNLRDMESYITQETQLFKDTIANNVRIGRLGASDEEVAEACKKASIHDFIMTLPEGYDTQVGELGETLSGGERQRLSLARMFLHDAPFVLLDEPTSNLDSLNEAVILRSLKEEAADKTVVLVSHRNSTVRIADEVINMESGRVS